MGCRTLAVNVPSGVTEVRQLACYTVRTRPMSCFNNPRSIDRILFAVFAQQNANWEDAPLTAFTQNS